MGAASSAVSSVRSALETAGLRTAGMYAEALPHRYVEVGVDTEQVVETQAYARLRYVTVYCSLNTPNATVIEKLSDDVDSIVSAVLPLAVRGSVEVDWRDSVRDGVTVTLDIRTEEARE